MIIDSSALLAVLLKESDGPAYLTAILSATAPRMSIASYVEVALRLDTIERGLDPGLDAAIESMSITIVPVELNHGRVAREAAVRYGRRQAARLNFGDCLTYALAKISDEPLLFKGNDFGQTDLRLFPIDRPRT